MNELGAEHEPIRETAGEEASPENVANRTRAVLKKGMKLVQLVGLYKDLHQHPELSGKEIWTAERVAQFLTASGADVTTGIGGTGVVGVLKNGDGPVVLIRADMDALPIEEKTGLAYSSKNIATAANGEQIPVMHACGHDVHLACLSGAVDAMARSPLQWRGTLIAVAQPAEETAEGAEAMLRDGLFERFGKPAVALAQHVDCFGVGQIAHAPGLITSGALNVDILITGHGGHGARPDATVDPVIIMAFIVIRLQTIVSREISPTESAVLTIGVVRSGHNANVIPDEAQLSLNLRFQSESIKQKLLGSIRRIVEAECAAAGCSVKPEIATYSYFPALDNDLRTETMIRAVHEKLFGPLNIHELPKSMGGEDFSHFGIPRQGHYSGEPVPYCYWTFGAHPHQLWEAAPGQTYLEKMGALPGPHQPTFAPEAKNSIRTGTTALTSAVLTFMPALSSS